MTAALQSEFKAVEPALTELARNLGQPPELVLRDAIEAKEKEWAHRKLDEAVTEAEASGFTPFVPGNLIQEVRARVAKRSAEKGQL